VPFFFIVSSLGEPSLDMSFFVPAFDMPSFFMPSLFMPVVPLFFDPLSVELVGHAGLGHVVLLSSRTGRSLCKCRTAHERQDSRRKKNLLHRYLLWANPTAISRNADQTFRASYLYISGKKLKPMRLAIVPGAHGCPNLSARVS
jgi:hypothetical protein